MKDYLDEMRQRASHTLIGRVYSTQIKLRRPDGSVARGPGELVGFIDRLLACEEIVIFGEVHDNAIHHDLRARFIRTDWNFPGKWNPNCPGLKSRKTGIVFEQIRADQAQALATFQAMKKSVPASGDLAELKRLLDWDKSGWAKDGYDPLLEAVIAANLPIYAGDPARDTIKKVAKEGAAALPADELKRLALDKPLPDASQDDLLDQLEKSHCGVMPKSAFGNLSFAQRYRDATQADAVLKAAQENGSAILFAGNGHVRKDRGVPYYLKQRAPDKKVVSVMLVEVEDGKTDPASYVERGPDGQPTADYIVFTPAAKRPDPCEEMRKRVYKPEK